MLKTTTGKRMEKIETRFFPFFLFAFVFVRMYVCRKQLSGIIFYLSSTVWRGNNLAIRQSNNPLHHRRSILTKHGCLCRATNKIRPFLVSLRPGDDKYEDATTLGPLPCQIHYSTCDPSWQEHDRKKEQKKYQHHCNNSLRLPFSTDIALPRGKTQKQHTIVNTPWFQEESPQGLSLTSAIVAWLEAASKD